MWFGKCDVYGLWLGNGQTNWNWKASRIIREPHHPNHKLFCCCYIHTEYRFTSLLHKLFTSQLLLLLTWLPQLSSVYQSIIFY